MLDRLLHILKQNSEKSISNDCTSKMENGWIVFNPGSIMPKEHVYFVYKHRYEIQRTVTGAKVQGYSELLNAIEGFPGTEIWVLKVVVKDSSFIIFSNDKLDLLIGILKSPHSGIRKVLRVQEETDLRGEPNNNQLWFKMQLMPEYKEFGQ